MERKDVYVYMYEHKEGEPRIKTNNTIQISDGVIADYDGEGKLLGVEILGALKVEVNGK